MIVTWFWFHGIGQHRNSNSILKISTAPRYKKMAAQHIHTRSRVYYKTDTGTFNSTPRPSLDSWSDLFKQCLYVKKINLFYTGDTACPLNPSRQQLEEVTEQHHFLKLMRRGRSGHNFQSPNPSAVVLVIVSSTKMAWEIVMNRLPVGA